MTRKKEFKPEIVWRNPNELTPYSRNAKVHTTEQIDKIAGQIASVGFTQPIVVDKDGVIIAGHGRREAALRLNLERVPVIVADHLDEYEVMAARIADNKVAESFWDKELLKFDLGSLNLRDFDMKLTGFDESEWNSILKDEPLEFFNPYDPDRNNTETNSVAEKIEDSIYTKKIEVPIYEPKGEKPHLSELFDLTKYNALISEINTSNISDSHKEFLRVAASRHIVFFYDKIAEFYSHESKDVQNLFENSALVIIDFNKAIELGFVKLSEELATAYIQEKNDE